MIIHILGPSGSGKTTLGEKISKLKNFISLDTDDIDDKNALKIMSKYNFSISKDRKNFKKEHAKLNKIELDKFLKKNKDKNIVFVGFAFDGMEKIKKIVTHKWSIEVDHETLFRQYNLRTLNLLTKYKKDIEKLLKNKKHNIDNIFHILLWKYKIRKGIFCNSPPGVMSDIKKRKKDDKKEGYKYKTSNEIYKDIKKL